MGCGESKPEEIQFQNLSEANNDTLLTKYDVVVIGSGYGGAIAACRAAQAGQKVCLLERGKEWKPGDFPESLLGAAKITQLKLEGKSSTGDGLELFTFNVNEEVTVLSGNGLGGTSLINANVALEAHPKVFHDPSWPQDFYNDINNFEAYINRARDMLKPATYDKPCIKAGQFEKIADSWSNDNYPDIEDIGKLAGSKKDFYYHVPLYVNMVDRLSGNHVGIPQPACNGCGNCCGGCNTGAKNTLNMNYLADARKHGAQIFTRVKVEYIKKSEEGDSWEVMYKYSDNSKALLSIKSDIVIVSAGTLGSNEVLLRSKENGLDISEKLGCGFSGNGDQVGISWANDERANCFGVPHNYDPSKTDPPGPTITSILDFRNLLSESNWKKGFILQDGTAPLSTMTAIKALMFIGSSLFSKDSDPTDDWEQLAAKLTGSAVDKTMFVLGMGHDNLPDANGVVNTGTISLDEDSVKIQWKDVGKKRNYIRLDQAFQHVSSTLGGRFIENPTSSTQVAKLPFLNGKNTISVHPLGGCNMANDGDIGVVNHKGQVFVGNTGDVHTGLYVMDGSVIPTSVGINPSLTICGIAERCMQLMKEDYHW